MFFRDSRAICDQNEKSETFDKICFSLVSKVDSEISRSRKSKNKLYSTIAKTPESSFLSLLECVEQSVVSEFRFSKLLGNMSYLLATLYMYSVLIKLLRKSSKFC